MRPYVSMLPTLGLVKRACANYPIKRRTETTRFGVFLGLAPVTPRLRAHF